MPARLPPLPRYVVRPLSRSRPDTDGLWGLYDRATKRLLMFGSEERMRHLAAQYTAGDQHAGEEDV